MKIYLIDINLSIIKAWNKLLGKLDSVVIIHSDFETFMKNYNVDCVVSPGNSHGVMAGGYDRALSEYFGWDLTKRVQKYIIDNFDGVQPVGTSIIMDTGIDDIKLIHTPTMINPSKIHDANVVYECTKSTLELASKNKIQNIVVPAFGGACGGLSPKIIAEKMHKAISQFNK